MAFKCYCFHEIFSNLLLLLYRIVRICYIYRNVTAVSVAYYVFDSHFLNIKERVRFWLTSMIIYDTTPKDFYRNLVCSFL